MSSTTDILYAPVAAGNGAKCKLVWCDPVTGDPMWQTWVLISPLEIAQMTPAQMEVWSIEKIKAGEHELQKAHPGGIIRQQPWQEYKPGESP